MKIENLEIKQDKFDINLKFYIFLKYLVKIKLSENEVIEILKIYIENKKIKNTEELKELFLNSIHKDTKQAKKQKDLLLSIFMEIYDETGLTLFIFSLKLYMIKDLLLSEAKLKSVLDLSKLENLNPLSLEYDKIMLYSPYSTRINGALLSLIFFDKLENEEINFISKDAKDFIQDLATTSKQLIKKGVEPNQIFMLMFSESVNQSIISDSGSNYENRILSVLESIGIKKNQIKKTHDKNDSSTEFDFFFEIDGKTYGIGAKRTLAERYKQFIKTAQMSKIDVMIEVTLGIDLTEEKIKYIRNYDVILFVCDEIYNSFEYLKHTEGVYSSKDLSVELLKSL